MAGSYSSSLTSFLTSPDAVNLTKIIEVNANKIDANKDEFFAPFTRKRSINVPVAIDRGVGPAGSQARIEKGVVPPEVSKMLDRKKTFYSINIGGSCHLYKEDIDDAKAIGGGPAQMLARIQDALPESRSKFLNRAAAAVLVYGVKGNTVPAGMADWLDVNCADGLSLFNDAHTYSESTQTYSNMPTTADLDASVASLQAIYNIYTAMRMMDGSPTVIRSSQIITSQDYWPIWQQIYRSEFEPATNNNAVNIAKDLVGNGAVPKINLNPWLPNQFYVVCSTDFGNDFFVQHVMYKAPEVTTDYEVKFRKRGYYQTSRENMQAPSYGLAMVPNRAPIT